MNESQHNIEVLPFLASSGRLPLTMSSREIAELLEVRHDSVKRTIERLSETRLISFTPLVETSHEGPGARPVEVYHVGKRDSYVVVARLSPGFTARLVDRWQELEQAYANPLAVLNDPNALRGLLLQNVEKVIALEARVEADKPKTEFYDQFVRADGLYNLQNAGRALGCRPNMFIRWLKQKYVFHQGTALVPYVQYTQMGLFEVKSEIIDDKARPRTFITAKGLEYFASRLPDEIKVRGAA